MSQGYDMYTRTCRRCQQFFRTPSKLGRICTECTKPRGGGRKWNKIALGFRVNCNDERHK